MGFLTDDHTDNMLAIGVVIFILIAPFYYVFKLLLKLVGWLSDSFARWAGNVFDDSEP